MTEDAGPYRATEQPAPARLELTAGGRLLRITETAARAFGARLCFAEPVRHADRTVIPVASVLSAGGLGFGSQPDASISREGGGGGGALGARPVGFIEISGADARFRRILTTADLVQVSLVAAGFAFVASRARRRRAS
jgi:uncharacterized spore protein YtfJ